MELQTIRIEKPDEMNFILGQSHFIKTVEDLYEAIVQVNPAMRFGIAFCEASQQALARWAGNDQALIDLAVKNAMALSAGHCFIIMMENGFPISILNAVKNVPEVVHIFCATANPTEVIVAQGAQGRGILGVIDGISTQGVETEEDVVVRKKFLRTIGYKL